MEDDFNILANGRRSQYFGKWKTTSIILQMEDDIDFLKLEDTLNFYSIGKQPKFLTR